MSLEITFKSSLLIHHDYVQYIVQWTRLKYTQKNILFPLFLPLSWMIVKFSIIHVERNLKILSAAVHMKSKTDQFLLVPLTLRYN